MGTTEAGTNDRLDALHARMAENSLAGHWQPRQQRPKLVPWLWQWPVIQACLDEAGEATPIGHAGEANNRRTVQLVNPGLTEQKATSRSLQMSVQLVKPGEAADATATRPPRCASSSIRPVPTPPSRASRWSWSRAIWC